MTSCSLMPLASQLLKVVLHRSGSTDVRRRLL
jgi:hypothetical protein